MDQKNIKYNICSQCNGNGSVEKKICSKCDGHGAELIIGDSTFFWNRGMTPLHIYQRNAHRIIDSAINFALMVLSILGLLSLGYYIYLIKDFEAVFAQVFLLDLIFPQSVPFKANYLMSGFWVGVIFFLYLVYRLNNAAQKGQKVKKNFSYVESIKNEKILEERQNKKTEISPAFTNDAINLIEKIHRISRKTGRGINPLDILVSMMFCEKISIIFFRLGITYDQLKLEISRKLSHLNNDYQDGDYFLKRLLLDAYLEAFNAKREKVGVEEIFISLLKNDKLYPAGIKEGLINDIMYELEINFQKAINVVEWLRINEKLRKNWNLYRKRAFLKPKGTMNRAMTAVATPMLDQFSQDLTSLAKYGYLAPCVGREKEIMAFFRIFESGSRGIILTGNPGVGKNTIVEGVAQMMAAEDVPDNFKDKRLVSLSIARLVSGAAPEQAMERLLRATTEAARARNVILFIENIESLIGISAGREGSLDLSEVLTSSMAKYNLMVIATTTPLHYTKYVEQSSLVDVFQRIEIDEPQDDDVICILEAKAGVIESKNSTFFSYGAMEAALKYSKRFIHDRFLPEKAINLIEEAGVFVRKRKGKNSVILDSDIAELISQKVKVPLAKITEKESEKLMNLEGKIHNRVVNQIQAVKAVSDALRRARVEFRDIKRPISNLLFLGPTGVGKTELAKTVAEVYFGSEEDMIRIDMSEYQNKESIDRLIGAPDDYQVTGILTEAVRKHPFALLLLDEIEKAHPDILNIFLQVMDDGRATDNRGRVIDFTNVILIATSNAGTSFIQDEIKKGTEIEEIKSMLMNRELKAIFKPEFLNRFDGIIVFKPLSMENVREIAQLILKSSAKRMDEKGIKLEVKSSAIDWIARLGYDPLFGARPLRRAVQENIDTLLADYLISGRVKRGDTVTIDKEGEVRIEKG